MKRIILTQGWATLVDDEVHEYLEQWTWCTQKSGKTFYAMNSYKESMHIVILQHYGLWIPDMEVDHKDRNGLHNWKENLRMVTKSQNANNRSIRSDNTSGFVGITSYKGLWKINFKYNKIPIYLGEYKDIEYAVKIRNQYILEQFGADCLLEFLSRDAPHDV